MNIVKWKCIICWVTDLGDTYEEEITVKNVNSLINIPSDVGYYGDENLHIDRLILIPCYEK